MMLGDAAKLLDEFRVLPNRVERPPTFMEIAGYPHYENACSNILAFFMDPEKSHGLGTLVLDALGQAVGIVDADGSVGRVISIEREVSTEKNKRIDMLIETDAHVILIENKIDARSGNPFPDYAAHLDQIAEGRTEHKILLTLSRNDAGREWEFTNLTYERFVNQIRSMLGHYIVGAATLYLTMFLDFLNTIENLNKGTHMNKEFIELLAERDEQVEHFLTGIEELQAEMRKKIRGLRDRLEVDKYHNVTQLKPWQDLKGPYDDLPHSIHVSKYLTIQVDTSIFPKGWEIWIEPIKGTYFEMRDLLHRLGIRFKEYEEDRGVEHLDSYKHKYDENLDGISSLLRELIDKIATCQETTKSDSSPA